MAVILLNKNKNLQISVPSKNFLGENNAEGILFLLPQTYNGIDLKDCLVTLHYINQNKEGNVSDLQPLDALYEDKYLQYKFDITINQTFAIGNLELWLEIVKPDIDFVLKTGSVFNEISDHRNIESYLPDQTLSLFLTYIMQMESLNNDIEAKLVLVDENVALMAKQVNTATQKAADSAQYAQQAGEYSNNALDYANNAIATLGLVEEIKFGIDEKLLDIDSKYNAFQSDISGLRKKGELITELDLDANLIDKINNSEGGWGTGSANVLQKTFLNVNANDILTFNSPENATFNKAIVQAYKFVAGVQDIIEVLKTFNNTEELSFNFSNKVEFNGAMRIKDNNLLPMALNSDGVYETAIINKNDYLDLYGMGEV
jgi:hypothetical protein